jgi:hypothetical protein
VYNKNRQTTIVLIVYLQISTNVNLYHKKKLDSLYNMHQQLEKEWTNIQEKTSSFKICQIMYMLKNMVSKCL